VLAVLVPVVLVTFSLLTAPIAAAAPAPGCAPVAVFAVPGTNETSEAADPAVAIGLL
jgi:hypothetical protein